MVGEQVNPIARVHTSLLIVGTVCGEEWCVSLVTVALVQALHRLVRGGYQDRIVGERVPGIPSHVVGYHVRTSALAHVDVSQNAVHYALESN